MRKILLISVMVLLCLQLILAVSPFVQDSSDVQAITIAYPKYLSIKQNNSFEFNFQVYNLTSQMNNVTTNCTLHLYDLNGSHLANEKALYDNSDNDFSVTLNYNNFTRIGTHSYRITCQAPGEIGFVSNSIEVNKIGIDSTQTRNDTIRSGIYFILALSAIFFFAFIFLDTNIAALRWTFFILFILFVVIGVNMVSITLYNEMGNTHIAAIFDQLAAASYYFYWFIGGILLIIWVLTAVASLADRKNMKQAQATGAVNYDFTK